MSDNNRSDFHKYMTTVSPEQLAKRLQALGVSNIEDPAKRRMAMAEAVFAIMGKGTISEAGRIEASARIREMEAAREAAARPSSLILPPHFKQ